MRHSGAKRETMSNWNDTQQADDKPGNYYVTAHDSGKTWPMAGPFVNDHAGALAAGRAVKDAACDLDGRACFMSWGTVRAPIDYIKPGPLNSAAGI